MSPSHVFLIIAKTGNGKSSAGNCLLGKTEFLIGSGMSTTTVKAEEKSRTRDQETITVADTPDIVNLEFCPDDKKKEVRRWKDLASPGHLTILLAVHCDVPYTAEEYAIYTEFKRLWGDNSGIKRHLVVAFTFGDRQERDLEEELQGVCQELKDILMDACQRYVLFNKDFGERELSLTSTTADSEAVVDKLMYVLSSPEKRHKTSRCPQIPDCAQTVLVVIAFADACGCVVADFFGHLFWTVGIGVSGLAIALFLKLYQCSSKDRVK